MAVNIIMRELPDIIPERNIENPQQIFNNFDHRGFNLFLQAAENGRIDEITHLLSIGFDVNSSFGPHTAASLAYQNGHFDTLLILLQANSKFPPNFKAHDTQHAGLIEFNRLMNRVHDFILTEDKENLQNLIIALPNLQCFYTNTGTSAAFLALTNMIFSSYEILVSNGIILSPDEDFNVVISQYTNEQKEEIRKIHEKYAVAIPNSHLMIIHGNLFVGHDIPQAERLQRLNLAHNAINFIDSIPQVQPILKLIARSGCFKIIFDFNRENIQFINPTSSVDSRGLFCTTRHIYIAAKCLTDDERKFEVYGTIAHELCHFAVDLVYNNLCRPYKKEERDTVGRQYHQILLQCQRQRGNENIIDLVWNYPDIRQFAELIVRVPHMMAFYANNQVMLSERRERFRHLFEFYETRVLIDVEKKIPVINVELNQIRLNYFDATVKKISKWRKIAKVLMIFIPICVIFGSIFTFLSVFEPHLKYSTLKYENKVKVLNGNLKLNEIDLKFNELYNENNAELLDSLNSHQLRTLINGDILDLNDKLNKHLQDEIYLIYSNLTQKLMPKLLNSFVNFQGQQLKIHELINDENYDILNVLTSEQIREILFQQKALKISEISKFNTTFYIERNFIQTDDQYPQDLSQIIAAVELTKIFLLSDYAGNGKTTTFKHIAVELKEKFPNHWISFVDLKQHLSAYDKNLNISEILIQILKLSDDFEVEIFKHLFNSDKVILLLDGVDEISPKFKDFFISFIENIRNSSNNQLWIATRPQHAEELKEKFKIKAYKFLPYSEAQKIKFIENILKTPNASEIFQSIRLFHQTDSPLMLEMIAELYSQNQTNLIDKNVCSLYEKMIDMKKEIVGKKGDVVSYDRDNGKSILTVWQVHQIYALKLLFSDGLSDYKIDELSLLKSWKNQQSKWTSEAISRYGILMIDNWGTNNENPDFIHRTFAEYFATQFLISDIHELDDENEIKLRLKLLMHLINSQNALPFISSYVNNIKKQKLSQKILKFITIERIQNILSMKSFELFLQIFTVDETFLREFRVDNETIFQMFFKYANESNTFKYKYLNDILELVELYENSLGTDWYDYTGYLITQSMLNNDEIEIFLMKDFTNKRINEVASSFDFAKNHCMKILKLLFFFERAQVNHDDLKRFLSQNFHEIINFSFRSKSMIDKVVHLLNTNFNKTRREIENTTIFEQIVNPIMHYSTQKGKITEIYLSNVNNFTTILENTFHLDKYDRVEIFARYCGIEILRNLHNYCTRDEIQNYFIKNSVRIVSRMLYRKQDNIDDPEEFIKQIFNNNKDGIRESLMNRYDGTREHFLGKTVFSFIKERIEELKNEKIMLEKYENMRNLLVKLAKEVDMSDEEIRDLSY